MKTIPNFLMIVLLAFASQITQTSQPQTKPGRSFLSHFNICGPNNDAVCPEAYSPISESPTDIASNNSSPTPTPPNIEEQIQKKLIAENAKLKQLLKNYRTKINDLEHVANMQDAEISKLINENNELKGIPPAPAHPYPDLNLSSRGNYLSDEWSV